MRWVFALAVLMLAPGAASANCADYGRTAAAQQQENLDLGCGFSGLRWHGDAGTHSGYCGLAGTGAADNELAIREKSLAGCRTNSAANAPAEEADACRTSEIGEGQGTSSQRAEGAAMDKLGRARAEMIQAGLSKCLWNDLGCTGPNGNRTCFMSVRCCPG